MIVNATQNGWEIIYHRAHALLAAELERFLEISKGPGGQRYDIMQRSDNLVVVKP